MHWRRIKVVMTMLGKMIEFFLNDTAILVLAFYEKR